MWFLRRKRSKIEELEEKLTRLETRVLKQRMQEMRTILAAIRDAKKKKKSPQKKIKDFEEEEEEEEEPQYTKEEIEFINSLPAWEREKLNNPNSEG